MPFNLPSYSRFRGNEKIVFDNKHTFGIWKTPRPIQNLKKSDVTLYTVESGYEGRPDLISYNFYGSDRYSWIIIMHNKPINTIGWPFRNEVIEIPHQDKVIGVL